MAETTTPKKRGRKAAAAGQPVTQEVVVMVPLAELHPFPDHPFQVRDNESMRETAASVKENGVIIPGLVRPREEGGYEIIAGHRRKNACELAGLTAMPVIVRDMDRDSATVVMVDSNLQRESILPSERAKAYKMKLDAIKRRAGRPSKDEQENAPNVSANFRSDDEVGQDAGVSGDTIRNYIALTQLVPELQKMVDDKKIALTPAYQLAALTPKEQALLHLRLFGIEIASCVHQDCFGAFFVSLNSKSGRNPLGLSFSERIGVVQHGVVISAFFAEMSCYHLLSSFLRSSNTYLIPGSYYTRTGFELEDLCRTFFVNKLSPSLMP